MLDCREDEDFSMLREAEGILSCVSSKAPRPCAQHRQGLAFAYAQRFIVSAKMHHMTSLIVRPARLLRLRPALSCVRIQHERLFAQAPLPPQSGADFIIDISAQGMHRGHNPRIGTRLLVQPHPVLGDDRSQPFLLAVFPDLHNIAIEFLKGAGNGALDRGSDGLQ